MDNCYNEFISHVNESTKSRVICAEIKHDPNYGENVRTFSLKQGHTPDEYEDFLKSLNFSYDSGYGSQKVFGFIWYEDGTWSELGEYDGSEWWAYKVLPVIPDHLR